MTEWACFICRTEKKGVWLETRMRGSGLREAIREEARPYLW